MHIPIAPVVGLLERNVYLAPWTGEDGEIVLLAITSRGRLATKQPVIVPLGDDHTEHAKRLHQLLDAIDPVSDEEIAEMRRRIMRAI
jgi:hypothetical protein